MTKARGSVVLLAVALVAGLAACQSGPSNAERKAASEDAQKTVTEIADQAAAALTQEHPELTFTVDPDTAHGLRATGCSDRPDGKTVEWVAQREIEVTPRQPTADLLDAVAEALVADGWTLHNDEDLNAGRLVALLRDGFRVNVSGENSINGDAPSRVSVGVYSPCLKAPDPT